MQKMAKPTNISERERQRSASQRASLREFCSIYSLGRTHAYAEIRSGRLRARKLGRRTLVAVDDAEDWLGRLPALHEEIAS
jgi:hypothetical protein